MVLLVKLADGVSAADVLPDKAIITAHKNINIIPYFFNFCLSFTFNSYYSNKKNYKDRYVEI